MPPATAARWMTTSGQCASYIRRTCSSWTRSNSALRTATIEKGVQPRWRSFSITAKPRKPAPPVTTTFFLRRSITSPPSRCPVQSRRILARIRSAGRSAAQEQGARMQEEQRPPVPAHAQLGGDHRPVALHAEDGGRLRQVEGKKESPLPPVGRGQCLHAPALRRHQPEIAHGLTGGNAADQQRPSSPSCADGERGAAQQPSVAL